MPETPAFLAERLKVEGEKMRAFFTALSDDQWQKVVYTENAEMTAYVISLSDADLQKAGRHAFLGITTLAEMIKMVYRHNQIHYRDLRVALQK